MSSSPQKSIIKKPIYGKLRKSYVEKVQKSLDQLTHSIEEVKRWKETVIEDALNLAKEVDSFKKDIDEIYEDESNRLESFECGQDDYQNLLFNHVSEFEKLKVAVLNPSILMGSKDNLKDFDETKKSIGEMFSEKNLNLLDEDLEKYQIENPPQAE